MANIRDRNDEFRKTLDPRLGMVIITHKFSKLTLMLRTRAILKLVTFDQFDPDTDPNEEHDFGEFEIFGIKMIFKIIQESNGKLVLTLMIADEY